VIDLDAVQPEHVERPIRHGHHRPVGDATTARGSTQ
jgi:hypothetical protein